MTNNDDLIHASLLSTLGKSDHSTIDVSVKYSSNNSTDKFNLDYNNADFDSMQKVFNDEFSITAKNFTDENDQLNYFIKTLNLAKELFIPRKIYLNNSGNHIKLDKTVKSKLTKKQRIWK